MKKSIVLLVLTLVISNYSLVIAEGQTWQELMDSSAAYQEKQDFQTALDWAQKALPKAKEELGGVDTNYASILSSISEIFYYQGNLDSALYYGDIYLKICRTIFKGDHPDLATSIGNIAAFYDGRGNHKEAEPLFKEALEMNRRIYKGDHPGLANSIIWMAMFYNGRGNYKTAEPLFKEAFEMFRRLFKGDHPSLAYSINNMASFYNGRGNYKEAEPLFKEALEMNRRIYNGDHPGLANSINSMALFYNGRGNYKTAEPLFKEALEMRKRIFKVDHPSLAYSINNMAVFFNGMGNYKEAEPLFKEALEMNRRIYKVDHFNLANSINSMALFYDGSGNYREAEPLYLEALKVYQNMLNNYFPSLSEKEKKLFWNTVSDKFEGFNTFAVMRAVENPSIISNMYDIQLYSKGLLFNATSKVKKRILNSNDSLLIDKYKEWSDKKELLVKLYSMTEEAQKKKNINVDSIEILANELEKELSLKSEQFAQSYEKKKVNWRTIQGLLKPDEAAVEVVSFRYNDGKRFTDTIYYAFLIVNEQTEEHPDLIVLENGNQLENEYYNNYRGMIKSKMEDIKSFSRYWEKLHEKLKGYKKIYLSADGIYNKLNPSTLLMPDGKYLLDVYDIQQINSTKDILLGFYETKQESNIYNSAVLIGNPNFALSEEGVRKASERIRSESDDSEIWEPMASTRGIQLTNLPGTEKEIKDIEQFLNSRKWDVKSYLKDMALKTAVKSANSPRVLHIATHGMFLEDVKRESSQMFGFDENRMIENPLLRSGLFFTGADNYIKAEDDKPTGDENGVLTAYEAMNLNLDHTELVVLSACETGLGEIKNGEGVFGLRRAFQTAGAKTIVMSLWTVSDQATQELMSSFYSNWVTGMTKREAFNKAQQVIKDKYKDPYYWGAFVMVGE
ncbi:tetratricopeptide repeat protein [Bacteroidota bacterium]